MRRLDPMDVLRRGHADVGALDTLERLVFGVMEIEGLAAMEGWDHFFTHSETLELYHDVKAGLEAAGDRASLEVLGDYERTVAAANAEFSPAGIERWVSSLSDSALDQLPDWRGQFESLTGRRWDAIADYLSEQDIELLMFAAFSSVTPRDERGVFRPTADDPTDLAVLCPPLTQAMVRAAEKQLGYRLPDAYVELLRFRNGGYLAKTRFPTTATRWSSDHVPFYQLMGIGYEAGIDGPMGSAFLIAEWGYPDVGVVISSEGHTAFILDYSQCGPQGDPRVLWVDLEVGDVPMVVELAPDFASFLDGLEEPVD